MDDKRQLLRHFLAALAYRTQKALRGAPVEFGSFRPAGGVRTPAALICHMTSVLGYARTFFIGGTYWPEPLPSLADEIARFHDVLTDLARHIETGTALQHGMSAERLLQGPFADAMTHAGQLAMLRRVHGDPVASENFIFAAVSAENVSGHQALPAAPDADWRAEDPPLPPGPRRKAKGML